MSKSSREIVELKATLESMLSDEWATEDERAAIRRAVLEATSQTNILEVAPKLTGTILETSIAEGVIGPELNAGDVMHREDYDEILRLGRSFGLDSLRVGQLWSQLEAVNKGGSNTRLGLFCLRVLVENAYLHKTLSELNTATNGAVILLNQIHSKAAEKPKAKGKK